MHRFYAPGLVFDRAIELPADEAHHLARVMRLKIDALVSVFDGRGNEVVARVQAIAGGRVSVIPVEKRESDREPAIAITLAQALLKSDGMDRVIRDAVMLGVAAIQPLVSDRIEVPRAALRAAGRQERWARTVIASVKQCGRAVVPPVHPIIDLNTMLKTAHDTLCLMCVEPAVGPDPPTGVTLQSLETRVPAKVTVLIGPEGGWAPEEISEAVAAGVTTVTFGRRVLRADAAGALAIAVLQYLWKDL